jgi:Rps23 Pro-64 3,4-dihydroxylase Tpa1-like proline 4-hydroxylase
MESTDAARSVEVEVTLAGGSRYFFTLPAASPLLRDLYMALATNGQPAARHPPILLQLPLDGGLASCSFMSTSLVAVITRPPVLVGQRPDETAAPEPAASLPPPTIDPAPGGSAADHVRLDDFLTPHENRQLLDYALASEAEFEGSTVLSALEDYRRSRVLFAIERSRWRNVFLNRLRLYLPHIACALNAACSDIGRSEIQLTASNDGDFFKPHPDASPEQEGTAGRKITYVYYFHRMPRPFEGGNLLLYSREPLVSDYASVRAATSIAPQNNCLIAFTSDRWHEIDIIRCPSRRFADSRFTVNGWVHTSA